MPYRNHDAMMRRLRDLVEASDALCRSTNDLLDQLTAAEDRQPSPPLQRQRRKMAKAAIVRRSRSRAKAR